MTDQGNMMTADMELSNPSDLLASLVSQDTAFLALPLFSIEEEDRRRKQSLTYETDVTLNDLPGKFKWQVSADPSYGFPDAFDRKVFKIMEALILENERPIKNPVFFSLYRVLQVLGLPPFGVHFTRVRSSVQRIAAVKIHAQFIHAEGDASAHESQTFHLFDDVTFQEEIFDDEMGAGNPKLTLGLVYLQSLNSGMLQPIGFEELQSLQNPIAGRLHEILLAKFTDRQVRAQNSWTVSYPELCKLLPVRAVGWMSSPKRQFEEIHNELIGYNIVDRIEWEKTEQGWTVQYIPGLVLQELPLPTATMPPDLPDGDDATSVDSLSYEGTENAPSIEEIDEIPEEMVEKLEEEEPPLETQHPTEQDTSQVSAMNSYLSEEALTPEHHVPPDEYDTQEIDNEDENTVEDETYVTNEDGFQQGSEEALPPIGQAHKPDEYDTQEIDNEGRLLEDLPVDELPATSDEEEPEREIDAQEELV
jgi:hypothetical protein